jgi:hypothetical protein
MTGRRGSRPCAALRVLDDDGELVAAHATDMAERTDFLDQALGDALQHRVALGMAERVVDRLEAVQDRGT